jgi:hypothetical protein
VFLCVNKTCRRLTVVAYWDNQASGEGGGRGVRGRPAGAVQEGVNMSSISESLVQLGSLRKATVNMCQAACKFCSH